MAASTAALLIGSGLTVGQLSGGKLEVPRVSAAVARAQLVEPEPVETEPVIPASFVTSTPTTKLAPPPTVEPKEVVKTTTAPTPTSSALIKPKPSKINPPIKPTSKPAVVKPAVTAEVKVQPVAATSGKSKRLAALDVAMKQVGKPYKYGAAVTSNPKSFDCSSLVQFAYRQVGVNLPRTSREQAKVGQLVARNQLQPGDLIFFYSPVSHVGIYIGDGKMVNAQRTGLPVRVTEVQYFKFNSARRVG